MSDEKLVFIGNDTYTEKDILEALDAEIELMDAKDTIKEFCNLIDFVFSYVEEERNFFWLGDNIHSVYYSEASTIEKARAILEEYEGKRN